MFKHTCSFGGWGEHTLLLLGFQRGLTFQKLRAVSYFTDKEIKECEHKFTWLIIIERSMTMQIFMLK